MNEKAMLFDNVFNNRRPTETTNMTKTNTAAQLPIDDGDLSDMGAIAAMLRQAHEDRQLIKARLDGITEALGALAADFKAAVAARAAQHTAAPAAVQAVRSLGGGAPAGATGGKHVTWALVSVEERTVAKKAGGTFQKTVAVFAHTGNDGRPYERDVPRQFVKYFVDRIGQQISFTEDKNARGYNEIVAVG